MKKQFLIISLLSAVCTVRCMEKNEDGQELFIAIQNIKPSQVEVSLQRVASPDIKNSSGDSPYEVAFKLLKNIYEHDFVPLHNRMQTQANLDDPQFICSMLECLERMTACGQILKMVKVKEY